MIVTLIFCQAYSLMIIFQKCADFQNYFVTMGESRFANGHEFWKLLRMNAFTEEILTSRDINNYKKVNNLLISFITLWLWENQDGRITTDESCLKNPGLHIAVKSAVSCYIHQGGAWNELELGGIRTSRKDLLVSWKRSLSLNKPVDIGLVYVGSLWSLHYHELSKIELTLANEKIWTEVE